jgi:hypothetical protein
MTTSQRPSVIIDSRRRSRRTVESVDDWAAGTALRWTRAGVLAACGVVAGALFHAAADGRLPGPAGLLAVWLVSTVAAAPLLGTEVGTARVVALLVLWQGGVHAALGGVAGHAPGAHALASVEAAGASGHAAHGALVHAAGTTYPLLESLLAQAPMVLGHALAAALAGLWLAAGERALWSLLALSRQRLSTAAADVLGGWWWLPGEASLATAGPSARPGWVVAPARMPAWLLVRVLGRRGPPVSC